MVIRSGEIESSFQHSSHTLAIISLAKELVSAPVSNTNNFLVYLTEANTESQSSGLIVLKSIRSILTLTSLSCSAARSASIVI